MRDPARMWATLDTIKAANGSAHLAREQVQGWFWRAGTVVLPGPALNDQTVQDLIEDGWLRRDDEAGTAVVID